MPPLVNSPCPYLPPAPEEMDAGAISAHGSSRGSGFYLTVLIYSQYLWQRGQASRAVLKLDRALGADLHGEEPVLVYWPLPYEAMAFILQQSGATGFIGNPRIHFQHLAGRMNEPRKEQRRWRIWGCWFLCRLLLPDLSGDPSHQVEEPDFATVRESLSLYGIPGEAGLWEKVVEKIRSLPPGN